MAGSVPSGPQAGETSAGEARGSPDGSALLDRLCIQERIAAYCRGLDRLDADLLASAFHPDATYHHPAFEGGRHQFVEWAIALMTTFERTHHAITTQSIAIDGDEAHAESYCTFTLLPKGSSVLSGGMARYVDRLERRDGVWAIATRVALIDFGYETARSDWQGKPAVPLHNRRDRRDCSYLRPLRIPIGRRD